MITISPAGNGRYSLTVRKDGNIVLCDYYNCRSEALLAIGEVMEYLFSNDNVLHIEVKFWN